MNPIEEVLALRSQGKNIDFEDFPFQFTDDNHVLHNGFIQDASVELFENDTKHVLTVNLWIPNKEVNVKGIRKTCIAPPGCEVEWDNIHCPRELF